MGGRKRYGIARATIHSLLGGAPTKRQPGCVVRGGLVVANTVGVGVLTNTGYMAGRLGPRRDHAGLAGGRRDGAGGRAQLRRDRARPSRARAASTGTSRTLAPVLGSLAGWTSLLVGFSAPVALAASTAGPFFATLVPGVPPVVVSIALIVVATASQAFDLRWSKRTQDVFALVKALLLVGFIVGGLRVRAATLARRGPRPRRPGGSRCVRSRCPWCTSPSHSAGWNTAIYAAEEFRDPRRTVPRAMLIGTAWSRSCTWP